MTRQLRPSRYAIVGSRDFTNLELVRRFVRKLPAGSIVVSGAARGVDSAAEAEARECGFKVVSFPADWSKGRGAGHERNTLIVEAADIVVAFWDGKSRGTQDSMRKAVSVGKPLWVYSPHGWTFSDGPVAMPHRAEPSYEIDDAHPWNKPARPWRHPQA